MCTITSSFTIVPGPPSTESIERTYHSPITDAERAVTHQSQPADQHPVSGLALPRWHLSRLHYLSPDKLPVLPLIVFHGESDTTVSPVNADHLLDQWLRATSHEQGRAAQSTKVERGQVAGGRAYTRSMYHDASGHAIVEKWLAHRVDHVWSGGSAAGSFTDPLGPDASTELLRFFAEQSWKR